MLTNREVNVEESCPESSHPYLVGGGRYCFCTVAPRLLLLDLDPRHRSRIQGIQEACWLHCCSKASRQLWTPAPRLCCSLGFNLRCAGMIFTLISLVEFDGVFKGLYFFSKGVFSKGPELKKRNEQPLQTHGWCHSCGSKVMLKSCQSPRTGNTVVSSEPEA